MHRVISGSEGFSSFWSEFVMEIIMRWKALSILSLFYFQKKTRGGRKEKVMQRDVRVCVAISWNGRNCRIPPWTAHVTTKQGEQSEGEVRVNESCMGKRPLQVKSSSSCLLRQRKKEDGKKYTHMWAFAPYTLRRLTAQKASIIIVCSHQMYQWDGWSLNRQRGERKGRGGGGRTRTETTWQSGTEWMRSRDDDCRTRRQQLTE